MGRRKRRGGGAPPVFSDDDDDADDWNGMAGEDMDESRGGEQGRGGGGRGGGGGGGGGRKGGPVRKGPEVNRALPKFLQQHAAALGRDAEIAPEDEDGEDGVVANGIANATAEAAADDEAEGAHDPDPFDAGAVSHEERERFIAQEKREANALFASGEYSEAIQRYSLAIRVASSSSASTSAMPGVEILYANRAAAYLALERADESLKDSVMATHLNPGWGKGWLRRARALIELKRWKDAADAADTGLRVEAPGTDTFTSLTNESERAMRLEDAAVRSGKHSYQAKRKKADDASHVERKGQGQREGIAAAHASKKAKKAKQQTKLLSFDEEDAA